MTRHVRRLPAIAGEPDPDSADGLNIGEPSKPLPGGEIHIENHPVHRVRPDVPAEPPFYHGMMAHGVEPEADMHPDGRLSPLPHERRELEANKHVGKAATVKRPDPIPVIVVEEGAGIRPRKRAITKRVPLVVGGPPVMLCGSDLTRSRVQFMAETNPFRWSHSPSELTSGGGALVTNITSYQNVHTQEEVWAWLDASMATATAVSVVLEFEAPNSG